MARILRECSLGQRLGDKMFKKKDACVSFDDELGERIMADGELEDYSPYWRSIFALLKARHDGSEDEYRKARVRYEVSCSKYRVDSVDENWLAQRLKSDLDYGILRSKIKCYFKSNLSARSLKIL